MLIRCRKCGHRVSDQVRACSNCRAPLAGRSLRPFLVVLMLVSILVILGTLEYQSRQPTTYGKSESSILSCNREAATQVQALLAEMATWETVDNVVVFAWGSDWDVSQPSDRLNLLTRFADSDACLTGRSRQISFYKSGNLIGEASPTTGVRLVD